MTKSKPRPDGVPMSLTARYMPSAVPPIKELRARGQICAFGVSSNVVPPVVKKSDWRLAYCAGVMRSRPVAES